MSLLHNWHTPCQQTRPHEGCLWPGGIGCTAVGRPLVEQYGGGGGAGIYQGDGGLGSPNGLQQHSRAPGTREQRRGSAVLGRKKVRRRPVSHGLPGAARCAMPRSVARSSCPPHRHGPAHVLHTLVEALGPGLSREQARLRVGSVGGVIAGALAAACGAAGPGHAQWRLQEQFAGAREFEPRDLRALLRLRVLSLWAGRLQAARPRPAHFTALRSSPLGYCCTAPAAREARSAAQPPTTPQASSRADQRAHRAR